MAVFNSLLDTKIAQQLTAFDQLRRTFIPGLSEWEKASRVAGDTMEWRMAAREELEHDWLYKRQQEARQKDLREFFLERGVGIDVEAPNAPAYVLNQLSRAGWDPRAKSHEVALQKALYKAESESWFVRPDYSERLAEAVLFDQPHNENWQLFAAWQRYNHLKNKSAATRHEAPYQLVEFDSAAAADMNTLLSKVTTVTLGRIEKIQSMILLQCGLARKEEAAEFIREADLHERPDALLRTNKWQPVFVQTSQTRKAIVEASIATSEQVTPEWAWPMKAEQSILNARHIQTNLGAVAESVAFVKDLFKDPETVARNPSRARIAQLSMHPEFFTVASDSLRLSLDSSSLAYYSPALPKREIRNERKRSH